MGSVGGGSLEQGQPVCVTGATGYVGSWLVRTLLRRGRRVHATARDPAKARRMLSAVEGNERLRVFRADMAEEGSFDDALAGCAALFHVAASMDLHLSPDQHDAGWVMISTVRARRPWCRPSGCWIWGSGSGTTPGTSSGMQLRSASTTASWSRLVDVTYSTSVRS
uniref:NAD-dependent epimerase/dehydratase domain-containing protein n=1 Tax=Triticum urartu TaxID=4572 RepID=A0A8R7R6T2_TRIUA